MRENLGNGKRKVKKKKENNEPVVLGDDDVGVTGTAAGVDVVVLFVKK